MDKCPPDKWPPIKWEIGQMPTEKNLIKEMKNEINDKIKEFFSFIYILNHDCNERSPHYFIIAIMDTIYEGQYKRLQLVI